MTLTIRPESPADVSAIRTMVAAAFDSDQEAHLVDMLRASAGYRPEFALVAEEPRGIVGHVMLTTVPLYRPDGTVDPVGCLAPLAVRPDRQATGVGRMLAEGALRLADQHGVPLVVVEGDPELYRRYGFVAATPYGLTRPSPTIPEPAFQVRPLRTYSPELRGRIGYPTAFWAGGGAGLPESVDTVGVYAVPWLFQFARYAGWLEAAVAAADLSTPVPACPGLTVAEVLRHLGVIYRIVAGWIRHAHRPVDVPPGPADGDLRGWFGDGWRSLYPVLAAQPPRTPAASWCPWDNTIGFWRRRMVHETAIHAHDILAALDPQGPKWTVDERVAMDGIDEALRLWLGTRLSDKFEGSGGVVRIEAADMPGWTVGVHRRFAEVHRLPAPPDAVVAGDPGAVYAWLWGRVPDSAVRISGDRGAVTELRQALALSMQ